MTEDEITKLCTRYNFVWATRGVSDGTAHVACMLRKDPNRALPSSGWLFLGREDLCGVDSPEDLKMISIERVLQHSPEVADYLCLPPGSRVEKRSDGLFEVLEKGKTWWEFWR
jgi:hypothetical protein